MVRPLLCAVFRQAENIHCLTVGGTVHFAAQDQLRFLFRAAALGAGRDRDELFAVHAEAYGIALDRGAQPRLPQGFASFGVHRAENTIIVAHERYPTRGRQDAGQEGHALLEGPDGAEIARAISRQAAHITVTAWHLIDRLAAAAEEEAGLAQWDQDQVIVGIEAGR